MGKWAACNVAAGGCMASGDHLSHWTDAAACWTPPTAVAEVSGVDANQGLVMKEIEDVRRK